MGLQEYFFNLKDNLICKSHFEFKTPNTKAPSETITDISKIKSRLKDCIKDHGSPPEEAGPSEVKGGDGFGFAALLQKTPAPPSAQEEQMPLSLGLGGIFGGVAPEALDIQTNEAEDVAVHPKADDDADSNPYSTLCPLIDWANLDQLLSDLLELNRKYQSSPHLFLLQVETGHLIRTAVESVIRENEDIEAERLDRKQVVTEESGPKRDCLQKLVRLVFSHRLYQVTVSNRQLCKIFEIAGTEGIMELKTIKNFKPFVSCFNKMTEVLYRWVQKKSSYWEFENQTTRQQFYKVCNSALHFYNKLVKHMTRDNPTSIEKELVLFDLFVTIYFKCNCSLTLDKYLYYSESTPRLEKNFGVFVDEMVSRHETIESMDIEDSNEQREPEFAFILFLLRGMSSVTKRFFITETSSSITKHLPKLVEDLTRFTGLQRSNDGGLNEELPGLLSHKTVIFPGYDNGFGLGESQLNPEMIGRRFEEKAKDDVRISNSYFLSLLPIVLDLQNNIIFCAEESCLDSEQAKQANETAAREDKWDLSKKDAINLILGNFKFVLSQSYFDRVSNTDSKSIDKRMCLAILKKVLKQAFSFTRKLSLMDSSIQKSPGITPDSISQLYHILRYYCEKHRISFHQVGVLELKNDPEMVTLELIEIIAVIEKHHGLVIKKESYRRKSIHSDQQNLLQVQKLTRNSNKYNEKFSSSRSHAYYKNIFLGQVEIEVDQRELYMGLSRSFIKIFNKMMFSLYYMRFDKLEHVFEEEFKRSYFFIETDENEIVHPAKQFIISMRTSYFYNDLFNRAIILYEKLLDELNELKSYIYNESAKNLMIVNFFAKPKKHFEVYPYIKNMMDLSLHLSSVLNSSVLHNDSWGVVMSRFFICISLLNNLTQDNYDGFKKIFSLWPYQDSQLEELKEEPDEKREFEQQHKSFVVSVCCRLQRFLEKTGFEDKYNIGTILKNSTITTSLPVASLWLNFIDSIMFNSTEVAHFIYYKLFTRYLLKMLFFHEDISNVEVLFLKKSISSFFFHLAKSEEVLDNLIKYHYDLRHVYDYTIKLTKLHILGLIRQKQTTFTRMAGVQMRKVGVGKKEEKEEKEENTGNLIKLIGIFAQDIKIIRSYMFHKVEKVDKSNKNIIQCNTNIFGSCNFTYIEISDLMKMLEDVEDMDLNTIIECYKQSDNRDLGFQFINSLIKIMNKVEFNLGLKLWSTRKEKARVHFEVEEGKLPKSKLFELKIVYFLSMVNKQIEVVNNQGQNILISFRKYPEVYTLENLNPLFLIQDFKFEDLSCRSLASCTRLSRVTRSPSILSSSGSCPSC